MYCSESLWVPLQYSVSRRQQNSKREQNCKAWGNFCQQNECQRVYWRVCTNQSMCKNKQQRQKRVYSLTPAHTETKWLFTRENDGSLDLVDRFVYFCVKVVYIWKLIHASEEIMQTLDFWLQQTILCWHSSFTLVFLLLLLNSK